MGTQHLPRTHFRPVMCVKRSHQSRPLIEMLGTGDRDAFAIRNQPPTAYMLNVAVRQSVADDARVTKFEAAIPPVRTGGIPSAAALDSGRHIGWHCNRRIPSRRRPARSSAGWSQPAATAPCAASQQNNTQCFYGSSYLVVLSWIIASSRALIGLLTLGAGTHLKRRKAAMQACFLIALLVASTAGAAAQQGTLALMPPPAMPALQDGTFNVDNLPDGPLPASLFDFRSQALIVCLRHAALSIAASRRDLHWAIEWHLHANLCNCTTITCTRKTGGASSVTG